VSAGMAVGELLDQPHLFYFVVHRAKAHDKVE